MPPNLTECGPASQVVLLLSENDAWRRSRNVFCRWSWMLDGRFGAENRNCGKPGALAAPGGGTSMPSCRPDVAGDERAPAIAIVDAEAAAELVDDGARNRCASSRSPACRRATSRSSSPRFVSPVPPLPPGALERERVGVRVLPARRGRRSSPSWSARGRCAPSARSRLRLSGKDLAVACRSRHSRASAWFGSG